MLAYLLSHCCCSDLFVWECAADTSPSERKLILNLIAFTHPDFKWKLLKYYHMIMNRDWTQKFSLQLNKTCKMMHFSAHILSALWQGPVRKHPSFQLLLFQQAPGCCSDWGRKLHTWISSWCGVQAELDTSSTSHSLDTVYQSIKQLNAI